jgi:hypothetical protein
VGLDENLFGDCYGWAGIGQSIKLEITSLAIAIKAFR